MIAVLLTGAVLGFSAGVAPGPLLVLVISQTLRFGVHSGFKVAVAPLITDPPIIVLTLLLVYQLSELAPVLGLLSMFGAAFVGYLGWQSVRFQGEAVVVGSGVRDRSLQKAILASALSPHPWLFWLSVGGPIIVRAAEDTWVPAAGFMAVFYGVLVGSKLALALLTARSRHWLTGSVYTAVIRSLGVLLWVLAVLLFYDGLQMFRA